MTKTQTLRAIRLETHIQEVLNTAVAWHLAKRAYEMHLGTGSNTARLADLRAAVDTLDRAVHAYYDTETHGF
jgi:hypothetical protein